MNKTKLPNVPYVEAHHQGSKQKPTAIVLSLSSTTSDKGAALGIANHLHKSNAPTNSFHYLVDEAETYRGVWDQLAAYDSPYRAIDVLICGQPRENALMWEEDPGSCRALLRASVLVAKLTLIHKIPVRYIDGDDLLKWGKHKWRRNGGIIVRMQGEFPYELFLSDVSKNVEVIRCRAS